MALIETVGHQLEVGDKVRMNISIIAEGEMDGVEFTASGKNYWRYMNEHPDEVYTVIAIDENNEDCPYVLSGYMESDGGNWSSDELFHVPEPANRFEVIKNMTVSEMAKGLIPMLIELCEEGVPSEETVQEWLLSNPSKE